MRATARVTAVLGPTNTGKTHYAIERMLGHRTGVIGLPLRLLAREVYDRIVAQRGPSVVALVTGEERIVPERTQYWVCTVEAMPMEIGADFVAVDEIQLCGDPERGHVFTDRLLRARGLVETMFLGSDVMRGAIAALVPHVTFLRRERFSTLTYAGSKKISRMPPRSAIVGFSVDNVYAIAELIRRQKGGCAVVMGALSPRTRNAQVALYQNGDVDYLVATDAIGLGLNLDIRHVAFSSTVKFDGRRMRPLFPHELGQIAGRAGRHTEAGTFGVTGEASPLDEGVVDAIENHRFAPIQRLHWRNDRLEFGTVERLIASLEEPTSNEWLSRARESDDLHALKALSEEPEVRARLHSPHEVRLLWDVCRIPDFRSISTTEHVTLLARIFGFLCEGKVPNDWLAGAIARIDRPSGDIDTLSKRLAYIRTWTYVAQRRGWVQDESHWREETRAVEDRLSDALHGALTQRFVDRRTSVLMRRLKQKESLVAEVNDKGEVTVEGEFVGRLEGFRFRQDASNSPDEARTLRQAAVQALRPEFHLRADRFYNSPDTEMDFTEQGGLMWGEQAVGKLIAGPEPMRPQVEAFVDEDAGPEVAEKVRRRLQHFIDRKVAAQFEPLLAMSRDETLTGLARGFAFRLVESLGLIPREQVAEEVKSLDQEARSALRKHGVRFGQFTIFLPLLLKPAPTRLRLVLWSLANGLQEFPESPPPGLVTIPHIADVPKMHYTLAGYHPAGQRAIRIDMLERLADLLRAKDSRAGFEATPDMLSITGMTLEQFAGLMQGLGYRAEPGERPKVKAAPAAAEAAPAEGEAPAEAPAEEAPAAEAPPADAEAAPDAPAEEPAAVEVESFYTFTWAPRRPDRGPRRHDRGQGEGRNRGPRATPADAPAEGATAEARPPRGDRPERQGHGHGGKPKGKGGKPDRKGADRNQPKSFESRPARSDRIDPDNPFAVLAALRDRS
ncbi:helicase-related protein [Cereibacter sphaeroides]|uniref:helicase-related protein n=1 Tax=Cereibacter sphaeroides TaxID=1063 RepID=UPI000F51B095|nr:helicase-related protein [Cereibacter sphaeroides]AZB67855.1 helicase [Cereibacter sphaeroides]